MSSTINASTASGGGIITSADASGVLALQTAGVTGITIDASQNVKLSATGTTIQNSSGRPILNQTGSVLQVVSFVTNANYSTASSTPTDTQLTLSITLSSTSSKVLVMVHHADAGKAENAINGVIRLVRNGTVVLNPASTIGRSDNAATNFSGGFDFHFLDSPATAGSVTYKTQAWSAENLARFYLGFQGMHHIITLMEIAG